MIHMPTLKYTQVKNLREAVKVLENDGYSKVEGEYWELSKDQTQVLYCQKMSKKV